jgi:ppGpp synthetase/RelA/SpoT-type nucleotidyltranferase
VKEVPLTSKQRKLIASLVELFETKKPELTMFVDSLRVRIQETKELFSQIHSLKWRLKDPIHLKDKLERKLREAQRDGLGFDYSTENLFTRISDLGGLRILHLHTRQMDAINRELMLTLEEGQFKVLEGPVAKTWDNESAKYFKEIKIKTEDSDTLYTSVHYIIESNSKTKYTCELQVRTLAEELWGEVSHAFNYPHQYGSIACSEQIKVLARVTSGCSRLVDAIFRSKEEYQAITKK